jgi:tetratricopeptide (TPR) repeat protein
MTIQSSIQELGLFDLFQLLHLHAKTGRLIISDGPEGKQAQVLFIKGSLCFAAIHDRVTKSIESLLYDWGILDETALARVEKAHRNYKKLVDCLEGEDIVSKNHLEGFVAARVREFVYEIFKWNQGDCRFVEEDLDERREILVPMNTENMILEGARRIDEWANIKSKVPTRHSVFKICSGEEEEQRLNLKPREWEILSLIDGKRSVLEVNDAVDGDLFTTSKLIYGLVVMTVIELVDGEDQSEEGLGGELRLDELLKSGKELYGRLNLEMAATAFEKALQLEPDNFEALRMLGEIYYKMDRLSEALQHLRKAREIKPENQKAMFIKGYLHARLGEIMQAINEWEELREKSKNSRIVDLVKRRIEVAKEWEKVLSEY